MNTGAAGGGREGADDDGAAETDEAADGGERAREGEEDVETAARGGESEEEDSDCASEEEADADGSDSTALVVLDISAEAVLMSDEAESTEGKEEAAEDELLLPVDADAEELDGVAAGAAPE